MFWGSFRGIYGIELTADGLAIKPGAEKSRLPEQLMKELIFIKRTDITICLHPSELVVKG